MIGSFRLIMHVLTMNYKTEVELEVKIIELLHGYIYVHVYTLSHGIFKQTFM